MHRKLEEAKREEGFTLIELLVVVIIIGILAAIAIPVFLNQRSQAWERAAQSDARNLAIVLESYFNDEFEYPNAGDDWDPDLTGGLIDGSVEVGGESFNPSPLIEIVYAVDSAENTFQLCVTHDNIEDGDEFVAVYDSAGGGLLQAVNRNNTVAPGTTACGSF